jgi:hypothetical protein
VSLHDALVVVCGKLYVRRRNQRQIAYWKKASTARQVSYHTVVTIGAHLLQSEKDCNQLLSHIRIGFTVIHLIPTQFNLSPLILSGPHSTVFLGLSAFGRSKPEWNIPNIKVANVPATPVELRVVSTYHETLTESSDEPAGDTETWTFPSMPEGAPITLFDGCAVRAYRSEKLQSAGIGDGLIGIVECFQDTWPVVRFCNGVVQRVGLELTGKQPKEDQVPMMPLIRCNRLIEVRAIEEVSVLPPGWRLSVDHKCNTFAIRHLL